MTARLDAAYFGRAILESAEIAVGDGYTRFDPRRQKSQPAVNAFQSDLQPGLGPDLVEERLVLGALPGPWFFNPQAVDIRVQHAEPTCCPCMSTACGSTN